MSLFIKSFTGILRCKSVSELGRNGGDLKRNISEIEGLSVSDIIVTCNGRLVGDDEAVQGNCVYHANLKLRGGKGGFGSMLRMLGAQIEKTTNHEACRDLSGRRMRDVNNEKKLAEWVKKKADAEAERERRRREKLERMARDPKHYFVDPNYDQQKQDVAESLDEAVTKGIEASASTSNGASTSGTSSSVKRKTGVNGSSATTKKRCMWMGVEDESDEDDEENAESPQGPGASEDRTQEDESSSSSDKDSNDETMKDTIPTSQTDSEASSTNQLQEKDTPNSDDATASTQEDTGPVDLAEYNSAADLEAVGLDRLKAALMERGLKCGGTLQQRAERLYSVKGLSPEEIDPSLKAKPAKGKKKGKK